MEYRGGATWSTAVPSPTLAGVQAPPPLRAGDLCAVVAPCSPFPREGLLAGLAWLGQRYRLRASAGLFERSGFLAGDDERRTAELARAMLDPDVRAIFCARGGYGATRILSRLPWAELARSPKWIVGFSDVTALHAGWASAGVASVHAPNVTGVGASSARFLAQNRGALLGALERPGRTSCWADLEVVRKGGASGPLFGGNLSLLTALAAAGRLAVPQGAIVLLEDVTERPYRIDRMLTSLLDGGYLSRASAVVFGGFDQCSPGPDGVTARDVAVERTRALGVPVLWGAPFGHGEHNEAFIVGASGEIAAGSLSWRADV